MHIGQKIKEVLEMRHRPVTWLAREINCERTNVYNIFSRKDISTGLLQKIGIISLKTFLKKVLRAESRESEKKCVTLPANMRTGVFVGSFNPFTIGHDSIVQRALPLFDRLVIGVVGDNVNKPGMCPAEERMQAIQQLYKNQQAIEVKT